MIFRLSDFSQKELEFGFPLNAKEINGVIVIESTVLQKRAEFEMQIRIYWIFYDTVKELKNTGLVWEGKNEN